MHSVQLQQSVLSLTVAVQELVEITATLPETQVQFLAEFRS